LSETDTSQQLLHTQQELRAAREEASLTLDQLHLVQEELEVFFLKSEELSQALNSRDTQLQSLQDQHSQATQQLTHQLQQAEQRAHEAAAQQHEQAAQLQNLQDQHSQATQQLTHQLQQAEQRAREAAAQQHEQAAQLQNLQDRHSQAIQQLTHQLQQAEQRAHEAEASAQEIKTLLTTAQKMLEGQANYLQDLSRKEEQAELAVERERQFTAEVLYLLKKSPLPRGLDPKRIPRLRTVLQDKLL
jgi:chromosome segregation ATPase